MNDEISFANAHPSAQKLMQDDFFYDVTDQFSPFGDDDSWETFMAFKEWLPDNPKRNRSDFISAQLSYFGYPSFDLNTTDFRLISEYIHSSSLHDRYLYGTDEVIISTAFAQLYLEGRMDLNIRNLAVTAIKRQTLPEMLAKYSGTGREEVVGKYNKLLKVLRPE